MVIRRRLKYGNIKVEFDGHKFDSKREANRYIYLKSLEKKRVIEKLAIHPEFVLEVKGMIICKYIADFSYFSDGKFIVEDVKSKFTKKISTYRLKKKLLLALYNIEITEIDT